MTNLKEQQGGGGDDRRKPSTIKTATWSNIDALNQLMTPVPLTDSDLQQELDFYASTQFRYNNGELTPTATRSTNAHTNYFESAPQRTSTFQNSTPQLNIPVDPNDYASSNNLRNENNNFNTPSSAITTSTATQSDQQYNNNGNNKTMNQNIDNLSILFEQQQQQQQQQQMNNGDGPSLLGHEPGIYGRAIAANQSSLALLNKNNNMFSNHNTPINSSPNSPTVGVYDGIQQNYFDTTNQHSTATGNDRFASMFLSSNNLNNHDGVPQEEENGRSSSSSKPNKRTKNNMSDGQFRFKKSTTKQQLDYSLLSQHNMEQDLLLAPSKGKNKQKETATTTKRRASSAAAKKKQKQQELTSDHENDEEEDEDEPVIGDGAQSYSSMGSNGSRSSLTKDDKRRRNTAASARFRIKKKMREQALQNTACEMTDKAKRMEQRVHELEREIKWLKALVVEKNETRIEQLVRERPPNSTAFPSSSSSSAPATNGYQTNHSSSNNDEYDDEDDDEYSNHY